MKQDFTFKPMSEKHAKLGFRIHLLAFVILTPAIWVLYFLTDTTVPWPLYSTPAWAVGVLFHYLGVFVFGKKQSQSF